MELDKLVANEVFNGCYDNAALSVTRCLWRQSVDEQYNNSGNIFEGSVGGDVGYNSTWRVAKEKKESKTMPTKYNVRRTAEGSFSYPSSP